MALCSYMDVKYVKTHMSRAAELKQGWQGPAMPAALSSSIGKPTFRTGSGLKHTSTAALATCDACAASVAAWVSPTPSQKVCGDLTAWVVL